tara:strand:- start:4667 stop:4858 length:192 start_codon:yes stop_codon:yes gene_type:complete
MDILWLVIGIVWAVGTLSQIAKFNRQAHDNNMEEPYFGAFFVVWVLLAFTWPYWHFYDKNTYK